MKHSRAIRAAFFLALAAVAVAAIWFSRTKRTDTVSLPNRVSWAESQPVVSAGEVAPRTVAAIDRTDALPGPDAEAATVACVVRVEREGGGAVVSASVDVVDALDTLARMSTDSGGTARIDHAALPRDGGLRVSAIGLCTEFAPTSSIPEEGIRILLRAAGRIEGRVVRADSEGGISGARVLAVPEPVAFALDATAWDRLRVWHSSATTDETGSFVLGGLVDGGRYRLEAIAEPWATRVDGAPRVIAASADGVVLRLQAVYGAALRFACPDDAALAARLPEPSTARLDVAAEFQPIPGWARSMASRFVTPRDGTRADPDVVLVFALKPEGLPVERDLRYSAEFPGFEPIETLLKLEPLEPAGFPMSTVELIPLRGSRGNLLLRLDGKFAELAASRGAKGRLRLTPTAGTTHAQTLQYPVAWSGGGLECHVAEVPTGRYGWSLSLEAGWVDIGAPSATGGPGAGEIEIAEQALTTLAIPVPEVGYLRIECVDTHGPVFGSVELGPGSFAPGGSHKWIRVLLYRGAPMLVGPLPPGQYEVRVGIPRPLAEGARAFVIEAGAVTSEVLVLP